MKRLLSATLLIVALLALMLSSCSKSTQELYQEQYDLGIKYLSEGNYEQAIIAFEAAIEINPREVGAYLGIADTYVAYGDSVMAVRFLDEVVKSVESETLTFEDENGEADPDAADDFKNELDDKKSDIYDTLTDEEKQGLNDDGIYGTDEERAADEEEQLAAELKAEFEASLTAIPVEGDLVVSANDYINNLNKWIVFSKFMPTFSSIDEVDYDFLIEKYFNEGTINGITAGEYNFQVSEIPIIEKAVQENFNPNFAFDEDYQFADIGNSEGYGEHYEWHEEHYGYTYMPAKGEGSEFNGIIVAAYEGNDRLVLDVIEYELVYVWNEEGDAHQEVHNNGELVGVVEIIFEDNGYSIKDRITTYSVDQSEHQKTRYILIPKESGGFFIESKTHI